jgi:hypothetical protein
VSGGPTPEIDFLLELGPLLMVVLPIILSLVTSSFCFFSSFQGFRKQLKNAVSVVT